MTAMQATEEFSSGGKPVPDVIFDQLEYLVGHSADCVQPDCLECRRYRAVERFLMKPFRAVEFDISIKEKLQRRMRRAAMFQPDETTESLQR